MNQGAGFIPIEWTDYSGGFTDDVYTDDTSRCARNDNLLIDRNKKTGPRPGSVLYYPANPQHPNGANRIDRLLKFPDETSLMALSGGKLAYDTGTLFANITGQGAHDAFPGLATTAHNSWAQWNSQYFITNDAGSQPIRVWKDSGGTWRLITAGLPAMDATQPTSSTAVALTGALNLANDLWSKMKAHFTDVTAYGGAGSYGIHTASDTVSNGLAGGSTASNLATLLTLTTALLRAYQNHHSDSQTVANYHRKEIDTSTVVGQESPAARTLLSLEAPTDLVTALASLNDLRKCYIAHDARVDIHSGPLNVANHQVSLQPAFYGYALGPAAFLRMQKIYDYANLLKARLNAHMAYADPTKGFTHGVADPNIVTVANATSPETLAALLFAIQVAYTYHEVDAQKATPIYHVAKEAADHTLIPWYFVSYGAPPYPDYFGSVLGGNWKDALVTLNKLKNVMSLHFSDIGPDPTHQHGHLFPFAGDISPYTIPGADIALADYLYALHYSYEFTVGTIVNKIVGPVLEVSASEVIPTIFEGLTLSNIPVLANTSAQNYDTAAIMIEIYRTTSGGNTFYLVDKVANGTTSYLDQISDSELIGRDRIYINGGVVDHDPPPLAKCVHITNYIAYYGGITDAGEFFPNRVRQAIPGSPDACPGDFFDDMDDAVVGISSVKTIPIVGCVHSFFRLDGNFEENGSGAITHQAISQTVGLASEASLVRVDNGLFFAGTDGFYFTDGYNLTKLSDSWNKTYAGLVSTSTKAHRIQGSYDSIKRRVWWAVQFDSTLSDNDGFLILDLNYDMGKSCWSSASNTGHLAPTACLFYGNQLIRGHSAGYIFKHQDGLIEDPYVQPATTPANWGTKAVIFDWKSTFVSWGTTNVRKWCPMVEFNLQDDTNIFVAINGYNDHGRASHALTSLLTQTYFTWGDDDLVWNGDDTYIWNWADFGNLDEKRYVPAKNLRCTYKQLEFTNAYFIGLSDSSTTGTATTASGAKTVTLNTSLMYWPVDCDGAFLTFAFDNYATSYEITKKNSPTLPTVLTILDPNGTMLNDGPTDWRIDGYKKGQAFHLLDMTLWGRPLSLSQTGARD